MKRALAMLLLMLATEFVTPSVRAGVIRVSETDFGSDAGLITFSEFPVFTINPTYSPADYGGSVGSPTVTFEGYFMGQFISVMPAMDCPGASPTACIVGFPTSPLSLDNAAPDTFITTDSANPTSPVLSGTPRFSGPIAILFDIDLAGVGFDAGYFDAVGSTGITAFSRDGMLLGSVMNTAIGIEFLGLVTSDGSETIAGVFLDLVASEPEGFAIDNVRFARAGQVTITVPEPSSYTTLALGLLFLLIRRRVSGKPDTGERARLLGVVGLPV